jgi:hypothetical protein
MCEKYNGWTNRETWAVKLWLDNEEGLQTEALCLAENSKESEYATRHLADNLEDFVTSLLDMEEVFNAEPAQRRVLISMSSDIGSLYRVNWWEIAESYLSEMKLQGVAL